MTEKEVKTYYKTNNKKQIKQIKINKLKLKLEEK